jgi:polar amino acid transport system substrate-binding protein
MKRKAAALLMALSAHGAQAACSRELSVGISELGFGAYLQDGQWQGMAPDLIAELGRRSGCRLKLAPRPRARVLLEFEQGQLDIITSAMQAPDRDRIGHFLPYAYAELDLVFIGDAPPRTLDELRQRPELKLGTVRGVRVGQLKEVVDAMLASRQAEYSPDFDNLAAKLAAGRLQAAIIPNVIHAKMRRDGQLPARAVTIDLPEGPPEVIGLYLSRNSLAADDVQLLQRHLDGMRREAWVQQMYARYVGEAETRRLFRSEAAR